MPHWVALVLATAVGWLVVAVVGGLLLGRALGALDRWPSDKADAPRLGRRPERHEGPAPDR